MINEPKKLTLKQELFCQLYSKPGDYFGNGTQAYIESFGVDINKKGAYASARTQAYTLLTKHDIMARIRELLELGPLNDVSMDRELAFIAYQSADMPSKLGAIREFNKLKQRITDKLQLDIPKPLLGGASVTIHTNNSNPEDTQTT